MDSSGRNTKSGIVSVPPFLKEGNMLSMEPGGEAGLLFFSALGFG